MYCPSCGSEYRLGYQECVDCKVPLVEHLPRNVPVRHRVANFSTIPEPPDNRPLLLKVVPHLAFIVGGVAILCLLSLMLELIQRLGTSSLAMSFSLRPLCLSVHWHLYLSLSRSHSGGKLYGVDTC